MAKTPLRLLSRATDILETPDTQFDEVPTPEWGADTGVRVRSLTAGELEKYQDSFWTDETVGTVTTRVRVKDSMGRARLIALAAIDETGARIFTAEHVEALNKKNAAPVQRLADRILELSRSGAAEQAKLGEASRAGQSGASASDSPSPSAAPSPS